MLKQKDKKFYKIENNFSIKLNPYFFWKKYFLYQVVTKDAFVKNSLLFLFLTSLFFENRYYFLLFFLY